MLLLLIDIVEPHSDDSLVYFLVNKMIGAFRLGPIAGRGHLAA